MVENGRLIEVEQNNVKNIYKYIWPADLKHNTLGIIGMIQVNGQQRLRLLKHCCLAHWLRHADLRNAGAALLQCLDGRNEAAEPQADDKGYRQEAERDR